VKGIFKRNRLRSFPPLLHQNSAASASCWLLMQDIRGLTPSRQRGMSRDTPSHTSFDSLFSSCSLQNNSPNIFTTNLRPGARASLCFQRISTNVSRVCQHGDYERFQYIMPWFVIDRPRNVENSSFIRSLYYWVPDSPTVWWSAGFCIMHALPLFEALNNRIEAASIAQFEIRQKDSFVPSDWFCRDADISLPVQLRDKTKRNHLETRVTSAPQDLSIARGSNVVKRTEEETKRRGWGSDLCCFCNCPGLPATLIRHCANPWADQ